MNIALAFLSANKGVIDEFYYNTTLFSSTQEDFTRKLDDNEKKFDIQVESYQAAQERKFGQFASFLDNFDELQFKRVNGRMSEIINLIQRLESLIQSLKVAKLQMDREFNIFVKDPFPPLR